MPVRGLISETFTAILSSLEQRPFDSEIFEPHRKY
jgi:hypothetical protein